MSNTSLLICASQCWPTRVKAVEGFSHQLAQQVLQRSGWRGRLLLALLRWPSGRTLLRCLLHASLPGIMAHYHWRKQHIAAWLQQQITQNGIQQLVIIGAGFDGLGAQQSAAHPQLQVIEIDRPTTIKTKQAALRQLNALQPNLCLQGADLACCSLADLLTEMAAFSAGRPTLILAEGVLMYLPDTAIKALLLQLQQSVQAPLTLVASHMQLSPQGKPGFVKQGWLVDAALGLSGERFVSGVSLQALPDWLMNMGFTLQQMAAAGQLDNPDPCPGELLFYATAKPTHS